MLLRLQAGAASDTGAHRRVNQDAAFTAPWGAAVADGVGGGPAGDLASAAFVHRLAAGRLDALDADHLAVSVREANWDLRAHAQRDPALRGMATTFTGLFVSRWGRLLLAHTGDSRAYRLRDGVLTQQTRDDSYVQALVDRGLVAPEDAASHPRRNVITASLSGAEHDGAVVLEPDVRARDRWMLCTDGLSDYVPREAFAELVSQHARPEDAAAATVALALEAGTRDNVTVVVCDIDTDSSRSGVLDDGAAFYGAAATRFTEGLESA